MEDSFGRKILNIVVISPMLLIVIAEFSMCGIPAKTSLLFIIVIATACGLGYGVFKFISLRKIRRDILNANPGDAKYTQYHTEQMGQTLEELKTDLRKIERELSDMQKSYDETKRIIASQNDKESNYTMFLSENADTILENINKATRMRDQLYAQIQFLESKQSSIETTNIMAKAQEKLNKTMYGDQGLDDVVKDLEDSAEFALNKADSKMGLNSKDKNTRNWPGAML